MVLWISSNCQHNKGRVIHGFVCSNETLENQDLPLNAFNGMASLNQLRMR